MAQYKHNELTPIEYFERLANLSRRFVGLCYNQKKRILCEYNYMVGDSPFSQIEINRLISNKKR